MSGERDFDILIVGSGPAGQKAAIQAAKAGYRAAILERERVVGGSCVHRGTIPSKALREAAVRLARCRQGGDAFRARLSADVSIPELMGSVETVIRAHDRTIADQLRRNGVRCFHGRASFLAPDTLELVRPSGETARLTAPRILIATGSRPRDPEGIPVDHEHILDSDSILSLTYLPSSLTVVGSGVIACEYASIFAILGVRVTMIDRWPRPLGFLDPELTGAFLHSFETMGGRWMGGRTLAGVCWDGLSTTRTELDDGAIVESEKMLVALGRVANLERLEIERAGLAPSSRGLLEVDEHCRTAVAGIYAAGDVIGPPSLASASMEQGRRAACHALGIEPGTSWEIVPSGIYTIPEMAMVGIGAAQAEQRVGAPVVGRAAFDEIARGLISGTREGLLKLIADAEGRRLLGVAIIGEGATELIHIGQMALVAGLEVDVFVEGIFNFPTLAEAYRVAALDVLAQRSAAPARAAEPSPPGDSG